MPPSILQYPLSSPHIQCPSMVLVTPSHTPVFLLQHIQSPKCLPLSLTSFLDWAIPLLPPTATDFHILSLGQDPACATAFSCQTVDDEKWCIFFFLGGVLLGCFFTIQLLSFHRTLSNAIYLNLLKNQGTYSCNSRAVPLSRHIFQASTTVEFDSNSG